MLDTGSHTTVLYTPDIFDNQPGVKVWIFAHIFICAAVERTSCYVDCGTQQHILAPGDSLFAEHPAIFAGKGGVPCGSQR